MRNKTANTILCHRVPKCSIQTVMSMLLGNTNISNTPTCNLSTTGCNHRLLTSACAWILTWGNQFSKCIHITLTITDMATISLSLTFKITTRNNTKSQNIWLMLTLSHQNRGVPKRDLTKLKIHVEMALKALNSRPNNLWTLRDQKITHQGLTLSILRQGAVPKTSRPRCLCRLIRIINSQMLQR